MTDFGMAKLLGTDPRLTPTYCPGTNGYMSPEALADPPSYTAKLDIFSCGVLFVQLITQKFPDPGPRTYTVELNDPLVPSGRVLVEVPELERRKAHVDLIDPTHPLLRMGLDCLKDKEEQRPTAEQLCSRLIALKGSTTYQNSLQQTPEELAAQTSPARVGELEQQLREREDRVEDLIRQVEQLQLQSREDTHHKDELIRQKTLVIQQKDELIRQKDEENAHLQQRSRQLQTTRQENEQVVAALQQSVEQKDLQIRELQQSLRVKGPSDAGPLKLEWKDGPRTPFDTWGESAAVSEGMAYFSDCVSWCKILMYNSKTGQWTVLSECPKSFFSIAVVNGLLTAIGGKHSDTATKTLLSLSHDRLLGISRQKWIEQFPPMTYYHNNPTVVTTDTSLIVAGGWGPDEGKAPVEVMDTKTLRWSTVASLPQPQWQATATICGGRMYIGGGFTSGATKSVLMCEVSDLLQSATTQPQSPPGRSRASQVWREIAELPVKQSFLITLQGQLLAIGGRITTPGGETSEVRQYDVTTNSWNVISHMTTKRHHCFTAVLPNDRVMVVGGWLPGHRRTNHVEIASII